MRALVVEDSQAYMDQLVAVLNSAGLETDTARSGEEALAQFGRAHYDLLCVDLHLPEMNGLDFCRKLRKSEQGKWVSVILLTSDDSDTLQQRAFEAGITEILRKSESLLLKQALEAFIERIQRKMQGRVLYIEDSPAVAQLTQSYLEQAGLDVEHYSAADHALTAFMQKDFDLVISDIVVEGNLSGIGLLRSIRALTDKRRETPFLAVSGTLGEQRKVTILRQGADDFVAKPLIKDEMLARIANLIAKKQLFDQVLQQQEELRRMAITDSLTGLYNKGYLNEAARKELSNSQRHRYPLSVLVLDLDHFKKINDQHGHDVGDAVLAAVGKLLKESCRDGDVPARFGGEEFIILLPHCSFSCARRKAENLRIAIESLNPGGQPITTSIGVTCTQKDQLIDFATLFKQADEATYAAKDKGRNCVASYSPALCDTA